MQMLVYYLIPWPGPQKIFLILILELALTIDMQSSPITNHHFCIKIHATVLYNNLIVDMYV